MQNDSAMNAQLVALLQYQRGLSVNRLASLQYSFTRYGDDIGVLQSMGMGASSVTQRLVREQVTIGLERDFERSVIEWHESKIANETLIGEKIHRTLGVALARQLRARRTHIYSSECSVLDSGASSLTLWPSGVATGPLGGNCDADVDECWSYPCANGAECLDSATNASISIYTYRCICAAGFANGLCQYDFIEEYRTECSVDESTATTAWSGNCHVDVDECASSPCLNGASCADSTMYASIPFHAYNCTCVDGWVGFNCEIDVDECSSGPCSNGALCVESACATNPTAECLPAGSTDTTWLQTLLEYYNQQGARRDFFYGGFADLSSGSGSWGGSSSSGSWEDEPPSAVMPDAYRCLCRGDTGGPPGNHFDGTVELKSGWEGEHCDIDVDDCASNPCQHESACGASHGFVQLQRGFDRLHRGEDLTGWMDAVGLGHRIDALLAMNVTVLSHLRELPNASAANDLGIELGMRGLELQAFVAEQWQQMVWTPTGYSCDCNNTALSRLYMGPECQTKIIFGCMDSVAINYSPDANVVSASQALPLHSCWHSQTHTNARAGRTTARA